MISISLLCLIPFPLGVCNVEQWRENADLWAGVSSLVDHDVLWLLCGVILTTFLNLLHMIY